MTWVLAFVAIVLIVLFVCASRERHSEPLAAELRARERRKQALDRLSRILEQDRKRRARKGRP